MFGISFFFDETNEHIKTTYPNVFKNGNRNNNRHATKHWEIVKPYGWLNTLYDVANSGLFTKQPLNAIDSVKEENIYSVFTYLSWKSAQNEYETEVKKSMHDEAEQKQKARSNRRK